MSWWFLLTLCGWGLALVAPSSVSYLDWDSVSAEDDGPEHVTAILGQSVVLNCAIEFPDGVAIPYIIQWQKQFVKIPIYIWYDGYPPHRGEGYEGRISLANHASLNISDVRESDQGWYECKVFFLNRPPDSGKNGTWLHLDVHAPPHFTVTPQEVIYVKVGDSIVLNCEAEGTPRPEVIWHKDDSPLEPTNNIQIYNNGHEVKVMSLRLTDVGDYKCMARNAEGKISHVTKVIVAGRAVISSAPENITKLEGDKAEFICEARALPGNITHRWYRNDIEIKELQWLETRSTIRRDGTLVINPLASDDMGKYTCEVSNGIGTPHTASAYLDVEYPARVSYTPTVQYLPVALSGIVQCFFEANPPYQFITWSKDGRVFEPFSTPGVVTLNNGSLLFQKVTNEHQGLYSCTPYNAHGTAGRSANMQVLVKDPPVITKRPQEMYQRTVNGEVKMPCEAQGQPTPDITWRRADGAKLPRDRAMMRGGNLTIKSLRKEDHGHYECVVHNEIATLVVSTVLLVESTTPHAPTNVSVTTNTFEATLSWLPAYDGGFAQHYIIWYRESDRGDNAWRTLRVVPDGATNFTIYSLSPNTEYDFQVLSRNELGDGMFSKIVTASTKPADYTMPVFPTDSSGVPYVPNISKPSGPKPGTPRNVKVREVSDGVTISWVPPASSDVPIYYYIIEYRIENNNTWLSVKDKILKGYYYTVRDLSPGKRYFFRVKSSTATQYSSPSDEVEFFFPLPSQQKAITAGIVGGFLFFIVAIILSICAVKICNKRKRRKQEKAYNMVACRVADARNGGHGPAGSPVPLKKYPQGRISGVKLATFKKKLKRFFPLIPIHVPSLEESSRRYGDSQEWGRDNHALDHHFTPMEHRRRFPKAFQYNVQMEYSRPLGWISRTPEGKFVLDEGFTHHEPIPSSQASLRDSFHSRSSGRSGVGSILDLSSRTRIPSWWPNRGRSRDHWKEHQPEIQTIYEPRAPRYRVRTSSPGPVAQLHHPLQIEDVSSVLQPSSVERSFPSTVSSHFTPNRLHPSSYELPSLRILHEQLPYVQEEYEPFQHYVQPVPQPQQVRAEVHQEPHPSYYQHPPQPVPVPSRFLHFQPQHHLPMQFALPIQDVHIMDSSRHPIQITPPHVTSPLPYEPYKFHEPYFKPPHFPHYVPPPIMHDSRQPVRAPRRLTGVYQIPESYLPRTILRPSFPEIDNQRPLATSSPPQGERRSVHVLSSPSSRNGHRESESSSEDRPVTYTRDRLHKTIGRVRSGVLRTERPFRHSAPELVRGPTSYSPATTSTTEEEQVHVTVADPSSRTSVTSASSGHGSKHSRGDSLQGDLEYSPSSSSGFASRNTSQSQPSPHAVVAAPPSLRPPAPVHTSPSQREPLHHRTQLDISVDENYEFDSISPPESSLLEKLRQYGQPWVSERGMSDSELYTKLYPRPKKPSKYDNIEIERRIPALKEEFQQFRRRQQERRRSEELESEC